MISKFGEIHLGIDASNLRQGGGVTHLVELLTAATPLENGISHVTVWCGGNLHSKLPQRPWLTGIHDPRLDKSLPFRRYWQKKVLPQLANKTVDVLFAPGGTHSGTFRPTVTMSQNLLPFESAEMRRYGWGWNFWRLQAIRRVQIQSFRNAQGVIFLTEHARTAVTNATGTLHDYATIPHGINDDFRFTPRPPKPQSQFDFGNPFRLLYVSIVDCYKHQWHVAEAVSRLRKRGLPLQLDLIGGAHPGSLRRLNSVMNQADPKREFIRYRGPVPYEHLPDYYRNADAFVFASSCENLPIILLEAMAAGLPIACSKRGPMPEVLGSAGLYFDPESAADTAQQIETLYNNPILRGHLAKAAYEKAAQYSWTKCADATFQFIAKVAQARLYKAA